MSGTLASKAFEPSVCRTPATMFRSLIGMGTPVSGGSAALSSAVATAFSAARAWSAASSAVIGEERADLVVEFLRPAQIMIGDGDRRELARADRRGQLDHG